MTQTIPCDQMLGDCDWPSKNSNLNPHIASAKRPDAVITDTSHPQTMRETARKNGMSCTNPGVQSLLSLKPVITAKGASTKYWIKSLNTYINEIFHSLTFNAEHNSAQKTPISLSLLGLHQEGICRKTLPNQTCSATCCGNPLWQWSSQKERFLVYIL